MGLDNLPTTISNLLMLWPIRLAYRNNDILTVFCISFVMFFSFVSHLVENHKHNMNGIGVSKKISYLLNRLDVLGCILVISRFLYLMYEYEFDITPDDIFNILIAVTINIISEIDKNNINFKWKHYIPLHSLWHIMAAKLMYDFLIQIYLGDGCT